MKTNLVKFLFRIFSFLADTTNGAKMFVKPKLWLGTLILGIGVTACTNSAKPPTSQPTCYEPAIAPDTVEAIAECYEAVDTVAKHKLTPPPEILVSCYEVICVDKNSTKIDNTTSILGINDDVPILTDITVISVEDNKPYDIAEQMPEFPGGNTALLKFISENLLVPMTMCYEGGMPSGRVIVRCVVEKDGSITQPEILRSIDPIIDKAAMQLVNSMPKWIPAKHNGETVRCYFIIPINIKPQL